MRIVSNGAINVEKVGELMDAPTYRFGNDTGETERMLMEYLQQGKCDLESLLGSSICMLKVNTLFSPVSMLQDLNQKLLTLTEKLVTETSKWQILGFCKALKFRYGFIGYATLSFLLGATGILLLTTLSSYGTNMSGIN